MTMRVAAGAVVGVLALAAAWSVPVEAEPTRPLIAVPMFVTDARGNSIRNLQLPDIEIAEEGSAAKIASIAFRGGSNRRVALFLDEYHVSPGASTDRARAALARFVERYVRSNDSVFVMKPLDPQSAIAPLDGIDAVHQAVAQFDGRRGVYQPRNAFEAEYMSVAPEAASRQRAQVVRAGLESLAIALHEGGETARALILVTEGFRSSENGRMRTTTLRSVARAARLANVPVYIIDPSAETQAESPLNETWRSIATQTGGLLVPAGADLDLALARIAADLDSNYVVEFQGSGKDDGGFHGIEVKVKRSGAQVRAPSGYWARFAASRFPAVTPGSAYAMLKTPHVSGLIQPWFRMTPAAGGKTRVTFAWAPRPGRKVTPDSVELKAATFEGDTVHTARLGPLGAGAPVVETSFEVLPGPLQISMAIGATKLLDTDVRYIEVPRLDAVRPVIAAIEFVRPRSLPEFNLLLGDATVMPTEARDFQRRERLLVRVRAFAAAGATEVTMTLLNRMGQPLLTLPVHQSVGGAAQFELPLARYPRGEYHLHVRVTSGHETVSQLLPFRIIG